ncbi:MAG: GNAT family N-acetyltransferase [Betaproteobacteria bacterium]|nr:GNAT family N-acetyltransferase [Betaproteobacteria bacterium]
MSGKEPRGWNFRVLFVLRGAIACAVVVSIAAAQLMGNENPIHDDLHYLAGWLAFAMLLVFFALKYQAVAAGADAPDRGWVDWLAKGASIVLYVSLFTLPLLGWGLIYARERGVAPGLAYTLRNLHSAVAWALVIVLLLYAVIALWRRKQDTTREFEPGSPSASCNSDALFDPSLSHAPRWLTSAEPDALVDHFTRHPAGGFKPFTCVTGMPGFWTTFDLLTTADERTLSMIGKIPGNRHLRRWLQWRACFMGSVVSEYCPLPRVEATSLVQGMFRVWDWKTPLLIVKDIPCNAPFLSERANRLADQFADVCKANGFFMVEGQALAWVPIDFADEDAYLARFSASRRRDIRRKLRSREDVRVEIVATGDPCFARPAFASELYMQYLEVYEQSVVHFDLLPPDFFRAVLNDASLNGRVFLYYHDDKLIGHNLCFIHDDMLVDKTIGFRYPVARENNLYFVSWMENLAFARREGLNTYIAGWTDPAIKAALGARFTPTRHAVYVRNPLLRPFLRRIAGRFEPDRQWFGGSNASTPSNR